MNIIINARNKQISLLAFFLVVVVVSCFQSGIFCTMHRSSYKIHSRGYVQHSQNFLSTNHSFFISQIITNLIEWLYRGKWPYPATFSACRLVKIIYFSCLGWGVYSSEGPVSGGNKYVLLVGLNILLFTVIWLAISGDYFVSYTVAVSFPH